MSLSDSIQVFQVFSERDGESDQLPAGVQEFELGVDFHQTNGSSLQTVHDGRSDCPPGQCRHSSHRLPYQVYSFFSLFRAFFFIFLPQNYKIRAGNATFSYLGPKC